LGGFYLIHLTPQNIPTSFLVILLLAHDDCNYGTDSNDHLHAMLKQFWELEIIGIFDNPSTRSQIDEQFLTDITFAAGRYQVSLP